MTLAQTQALTKFARSRERASAVGWRFPSPQLYSGNCVKTEDSGAKHCQVVECWVLETYHRFTLQLHDQSHLGSKQQHGIHWSRNQLQDCSLTGRKCLRNVSLTKTRSRNLIPCELWGNNLHLGDVHLQRKGFRPECRISSPTRFMCFPVYPLRKEISMCHHVFVISNSFIPHGKYFCTRSDDVCLWLFVCLRVNQFLIHVCEVTFWVTVCVWSEIFFFLKCAMLLYFTFFFTSIFIV